MAQLNMTFNANEVEPSKPLEPVPAGDYVCMVEDSDLKDTKNGGGQYVELTLRILEGEFKGQVVWDRINLINNSPTAQRIGQEQFSALCHATGVMQVSDTSELHGKPFIAKVIYVPAKDQYTASNDVKGYKAMPQGSSVQMPAQQTPAGTAANHQSAPATQKSAQPSWNQSPAA